MSPLRLSAALALTLSLATAALAACGARPATGPYRRLSIVASTDVYGDIAREIGGSAVDVRSLISSPNQDPHAYEANGHDELAIAKADVVIKNGGGYDDFMDTLLASAGSKAPTLDAVQLSGKSAASGGQLNEHVFYDFATVRKLVARLVTTLSAADPSYRSAFARNGVVFTAELSALERTEALIRRQSRGTGVLVTEPVPLYLLSACGLRNRTPAPFSAAVEAGTGVPPSVLRRTLGLLAARSVKLLVYNEQTAGPETHQVIAAARSHAIPIVGVTETLPPGRTYVAWMTRNLAAVRAALSTTV